MSPDNYTSFGSYAPLYINPKRQISQDRVAYYVLNALADHANEYGICWPGTKRLAALTHYSESSVEKALERLFHLGFVRSHWLNDPLGHTKFYFQLSPHVIYIRQEHIEEVLKLWERGMTQRTPEYHEMKVDIKYEQPSNQSAPTLPVEPLEPMEPSTPSNIENPFLSSSSSTPQKPREEPFDRESDGLDSDEQRKERLMALEADLEFRLSYELDITNPQTLIKQYGYYAVHSAFLHVKAQIERGKVAIKNPAGLLISIVQREARQDKRSRDD